MAQIECMGTFPADDEVFIRKEKFMYEILADASNDAFLYEDLQTGEKMFSKSWPHVFGIQEDESGQENFLDFVYEPDRDKFREADLALQKKQKVQKFEVRLINKKKWLLVTRHIQYQNDGTPSACMSCFRDISDIKRKNEELEYLAYYDSVTGLYNRNYFIHRLSKAVEKAKENSETLAVIYIDVDDFKKVNDGLGLILGDEMIMDLGQLIQNLLNPDMFAARFSTDEFCVAMLNPEKDEEIVRFYQQLCDRLEKPFYLSNRTSVKIKTSAGVAKFPQDGATAFDLVKNAQIVINHVKAHGKNQFQFFNQQILNQFLSSMETEKKLLHAIKEKQFILYYQPQYDAGTKRTRGTEALIRWVDSSGQMIYPVNFIGVAERLGCIVEIGKWALEEAVKSFSKWYYQYGYRGIMSINVSSIQMQQEDFVINLFRTISRYRVNPAYIELEITESTLISDFESVIQKVKAIKEYGVRVSLDDFGTGYSSLSYLKDIPIDTLKIDKSFVDHVLTDRCTGIITESVVGMVKKLGLETVAEGVETEEQYEYLRQIDCDSIQGYLFGKPMSGTDFENLIKKRMLL